LQISNDKTAGNENQKRFRRSKGKEGKENLRFFFSRKCEQIFCVNHRSEDETK
jgi:hypothetical protein